MEFEDFSLYDPACKDHRTGVWLTFGGDQNEVATYCCVSRTRKKSVDIEVEGHRIPLSHNESLREFPSNAPDRKIASAGRTSMRRG